MANFAKFVMEEMDEMKEITFFYCNILSYHQVLWVLLLQLRIDEKTQAPLTHSFDMEGLI